MDLLFSAIGAVFGQRERNLCGPRKITLGLLMASLLCLGPNQQGLAQASSQPQFPVGAMRAGAVSVAQGNQGQVVVIARSATLASLRAELQKASGVRIVTYLNDAEMTPVSVVTEGWSWREVLRRVFKGYNTVEHLDSDGTLARIDLLPGTAEERAYAGADLESRPQAEVAGVADMFPSPPSGVPEGPFMDIEVEFVWEPSETLDPPIEFEKLGDSEIVFDPRPDVVVLP